MELPKKKYIYIIYFFLNYVLFVTAFTGGCYSAGNNIIENIRWIIWVAQWSQRYRNVFQIPSEISSLHSTQISSNEYLHMIMHIDAVVHESTIGIYLIKAIHCLPIYISNRILLLMRTSSGADRVSIWSSFLSWYQMIYFPLHPELLKAV